MLHHSRRIVKTLLSISNRSNSNISIKKEPDFRDILEASSRAASATKAAVNLNAAKQTEILCNCNDQNVQTKCNKSDKCQYKVNQVPVYIKTYGCQMNESDTSIVTAILQDYGYRLVSDDSEAQIQLLMTCAIRDSAETKIWAKLNNLKKLKRDPKHPLAQIGVLGCMAERLKHKILETSNSVDIVAGPDAYRDLPRLFAVNKMSQEKAINCLLTFDETYSDIRPVTELGDVTALISITRGCDNLCSYCIVPFTRGRERARPLPTILDEVRCLMSRGIKEVTLLGQNVNSYRDLTTSPESIGRLDLMERVGSKENYAQGFRTVYKPRLRGLTFDVLLDEVAKISPELRVRFTSPHPKDFTDDVIEVIRKNPNIARCIHLPAQSGSDSVLARMRRGYTKQAYLDLVDRLRAAIPDVAITSDFIAGFCGETEEDHRETLDLIQKVGYNFIYMFPYSERAKTHAYHKHKDDVPYEVKTRRVSEIVKLFREQATYINKSLVGSIQLVLVESDSARASSEWQGRTTQNTKTILPKSQVVSLVDNSIRPIEPGDYVACMITEANSQTLKALPVNIISQADYCQGNFELLQQVCIE